MPEQLTQPQSFAIYTEEELQGFSLSFDLQEVIGQCDSAVADLTSRRKLRMDQYVREIAVFDGAVKQMQVFREHLIDRAKQTFVDKRRFVLKSGQIRVRKRARA